MKRFWAAIIIWSLTNEMISIDEHYKGHVPTQNPHTFKGLISEAAQLEGSGNPHTHEDFEVESTGGQSATMQLGSPGSLAPHQKERPLLSIVIPMYNDALFAQSAIETVLSLAANLEVIPADNGSTDETIYMIRSFSDSRVRPFFISTRSSYSDVVKQAVINTHGKYVMIIDSECAALMHTVEPLLQPLLDKVASATVLDRLPSQLRVRRVGHHRGRITRFLKEKLLLGTILLRYRVFLSVSIPSAFLLPGNLAREAAARTHSAHIVANFLYALRLAGKPPLVKVSAADCLAVQS